MPTAAAPPTPPGLLDELRSIVGDRHVLVDADTCAPHARDWTGRFGGPTPAVVRPADTAEVAGVVAACRSAGVALVPQGGNTGLVGGGVPNDGEVVVHLGRLGGVEADATAAMARAGAGAPLVEVQRAAAGAGLAYAVDLAARDTATVGGTVATNAGGLHVLRWGATRHQLLGVEAVLGDGSVVSHLGGLVKDNTGYDLAGLLCGSEGTLGVVTAVALRLVRRDEHRAVALVGLRDVAAAVAATVGLRRDLAGLTAAELVLDGGLRLVEDRLGLTSPLADRWGAYLVVEVGGDEDPTGALGDALAAAEGVGDAAVATDEAHAERLWRLREAHSDAIAQLGPVVKLDVTVPLAALATFCEEVPGRVAAVAPGAATWCFGHVGDGNVHVNVTGAGALDEAVEGAVLPYVAELGGSISAEHGIGVAKRGWLHLDRSAAELAAFRALKGALDPAGILNPGVLLPTTTHGG